MEQILFIDIILTFSTFCRLTRHQRTSVTVDVCMRL